jgi:hypothetical protein
MSTACATGVGSGGAGSDPSGEAAHITGTGTARSRVGLIGNSDP